MGRDVHDVDELVVGQFEERRRDRVVVDEANGLDREPVGVPGVMGGRIVLDRQLLERPDRGVAARADVEHVLERRGRGRALVEGEAVDAIDRRLPDGGEGDRQNIGPDRGRY